MKFGILRLTLLKKNLQNNGDDFYIDFVLSTIMCSNKFIVKRRWGDSFKIT